MIQHVRPAERPLRGTLHVPGDKSIAHRALMLGALCSNKLRLSNLPAGEDVTSTRRCLEDLGASIVERPDATLEVRGKGMDEPFRAPSRALNCGNSGTSMRLLMGLLSGQPFTAVLRGDASLSRRPMARVARPLCRMGARILLTNDSRAPVKIEGRRPLGAMRHALEVPSAQVKSAILLAGLFADGETVVEDSFNTRDHSERMLAWLGADARMEGRSIRLAPPEKLHAPEPLNLPGDISSAAFFLGAAAAMVGTDVAVLGVGVNPTRMGFARALSSMGAELSFSNERETGGEPVADLRVRGRGLKGLHLSAPEVPSLVDEVPLLAVLATQAEGESRFEGLAELRHKESDRLEGTAAGLRCMGASAEIHADSLSLRGPVRLKGASIDSRGDHRLAMAFAVAGLFADGETQIHGAECVTVSHPGFFTDLETLRT